VGVGCSLVVVTAGLVVAVTVVVLIVVVRFSDAAA
jgi:hypothetical protein